MKNRTNKNIIIVNADDFGLNKNYTNAIVDSFENGYLDSTSIMVNTEDFKRACVLAIENKFVDKVGLHLNLSEGYPLTDALKSDPLFCDSLTGQFNRAFQKKIINRVILPKKSRENLRCEIEKQIRKYLGEGLLPTFLDSHHHVHKELSVLMVLLPIMKKYGIHKIRIAKNTGKSLKNNLNRVINLIISIYPGIWKKSDYLIQSIAEAESENLKKTVEIEVHPYKLNECIIDKTKDTNLSRDMSEIVNIKKEDDI